MSLSPSSSSPPSPSSSSSLSPLLPCHLLFRFFSVCFYNAWWKEVKSFASTNTFLCMNLVFKMAVHSSSVCVCVCLCVSIGVCCVLCWLFCLFSSASSYDCCSCCWCCWLLAPGSCQQPLSGYRVSQFLHPNAPLITPSDDHFQKDHLGSSKELDHWNPLCPT